MKKFSALLLSLISLGSSMNVLTCDHRKSRESSQQQSSKTVPAPTPARGEQGSTGPTSSEIKELAVGNHSPVFESFALIARDGKTYAALQTLISSLPAQNAEFFKSHAVVAAFLGQRRTGGFGVEITRGSEGVVRIVEHAPAKGAMVTMALTTPFRIVAVPLEPDRPVALALDATWKDRLRPYRVTGGELSITGGFAGKSERLGLEGTLSVMRAGELATFVFEVQSVGDGKVRRLRDMASGLVDGSGQVSIARLDAFALTGAIQSPFQATGQFTENEQDLSLMLKTIPAPLISDNFAATGSLTATATAPPPPNRAITGKR
jgi:hypothetical protein